ncbi:MAG: hypothetical protein LDL41_09835 [Coleofasciculus sp. S288]|nr:hypothetical protein [Coleofasciculus sp. S288]
MSILKIAGGATGSRGDGEKSLITNYPLPTSQSKIVRLNFDKLSCRAHAEVQNTRYTASAALTEIQNGIIPSPAHLLSDVTTNV